MKLLRSLVIIALIFTFSEALSGSKSVNLNASLINISDAKEVKALAFEDHIANLYQQMDLKSLEMNFEAFKSGMVGYYNLLEKRLISNAETLSIIDFQKPSTQKRLYILDLKENKLLYHSLVSHGKNTGNNYAKYFSNKPNSYQSSLGLFRTAETYHGKHGYSLRLDGLENGINHNARDRAIVMHKADYVSESFVNRRGRLGRSWGCPALPVEDSKNIIDQIKDGTCLFIFFDTDEYANESDYQDYNIAIDSYFDQST